MEMRDLINKLNYYRDQYYNHDNSVITDQEYDELFDKLVQLEKETGLIYTNSPTVTVGYTVQSTLNKVKHSHPMLSLNKTKDIADIIKFAGNQPIVQMPKMDGLTCSLYYNADGELIRAETRGNGDVGENITNNAYCLTNIPFKINNCGRPLTIDGEVIVSLKDFAEYNSHLSDDQKYSHPRNFAAGGIRQLDTKETADKKLRFIAWRIIEGDDNSRKFTDQLFWANKLGFETVDYITWDPHNIENNISSLLLYVSKNNEEPVIDKKLLNNNTNILSIYIDHMRKYLLEKRGYPIDGLVYTYDDCSYSKSLGETAHHPLHSIAYKFYDESYETRLKDITWQVGKTGAITPVAVFEPVEIDGSIVEKASLHNVSVLTDKLGTPHKGQKVWVTKCNMIIPQIVKADKTLDITNKLEMPTVCPSCGSHLNLNISDDVTTLTCTNEECPAKNLEKFSHFVSKSGMNIDGLSDATLKTFVEEGLIHTYKDIYGLELLKNHILSLEGFGEKSYEALVSAINKSKTVKLENYLCALSIPLIGKSASKKISAHFKGDYSKFIDALRSGYDFTQIEDIGAIAFNNLKLWRDAPPALEAGLLDVIKFVETTSQKSANEFVCGKTFVITGAFSKPRSEYEQLIESLGGKLAGSVSKKTDYLLTNDAESGSSKAKKAKELGIPILSEVEFLVKING